MQQWDIGILKRNLSRRSRSLGTESSDRPPDFFKFQMRSECVSPVQDERSRERITPIKAPKIKEELPKEPMAKPKSRFSAAW
jgi:hypothetical protein